MLRGLVHWTGYELFLPLVMPGLDGGSSGLPSALENWPDGQGLNPPPGRCATGFQDLYSVDRNHGVDGTKTSMLNPWRCLTTSQSQSRQRAKGKRWLRT
jgi:hypothetical protein